MKKLDKIKKFYNKYIGINLYELIFLILFIAFCFYDTGYTIYKPGGIVNVDSRITGDNLNNSQGTFNMAYVSALKGKAPIYLISKIMPNWETIKNSDMLPDNETIEDMNIQNKIDYQEAMSNAKYVAFNKTNIKYSIESQKYIVYYLTEQNDSDLKIGDEIISYDNIGFKDMSSFKEYIKTKNQNEKIKIKYQRNNKTFETESSIYETNNEKYVGISIISILDINSDYNLKISQKNSESGPSGGLIMTLSIYNALTKEDITKGRKIVGTGTIDKDGNVGEIGGINYKLASAVREKADIFICPTANYEEVENLIKKYNYKIKIISVSTFDEAIEKLK